MSANTGRVGFPVPKTAEVIAGEDPSGDVKILALDADGNITVSVTSSGSAIEDGVDSAIKATVKDYADSNPLAVVLVDTSGDAYVASGGGGGGDATAANQVLEIAAINKINAQILDLDTGGGTANTVGLFLALPASGGPVAGGTSTNPLHTIVDSGSITTGGLTDTQLRATPVPISGTVTANAGTNLNTSALATAAKQPALGTAGTASADVITVQGIASMTKLLVTPDSVALPANQSVNVNQLAGTTTDTNSGTKSAGTLRVVIATDQPALTNKLLVTPDLPSGASTAAKQPALGTAGSASADVITIQGIASGTVVPISGTVTATVASTTITGNVTVVQPTGTNLHAVLDTTSTTAVTQATAANLNATVIGAGSAGTANAGVVTVQGIASMTKLLVTPDSVALPANQSVNMAQVGGVTTSVSNGTVDTGTQRVAIASNNTAFSVNPLSATTPVSTMNSASANSGVNSAMAAVFDDSSPTAITENSFGFVRMSANRNQYSVIRDNAGNERGLNIDANGALAATVTNATAANLNAAVVGTGTAGSAAGGILTVQGVASMTKLLVTPDSVALPANQSVNVAQVGGTNTVTGGVAGIIAVGGNVANAVTATANPVPVGGVFTTSPTTLTTGQTATLQFTAAQNAKHDVTTIAGTAADTNSGNKSAGTLRVVLATDQPALTNKLLVTPDANSAINLAQVNGTTTVNGGSAAGILAVGGPNATNVAITGNPVNNGAQAVSSENAAVTTARQVQLVADLVGKLIVLPYANPENFVSGAITTAMTGTTSTSLIAAPASGLRNYITQITVSNAHATVGTDIIIQDGSGGTTLYTIPAAATYGGATLSFPTPLRQPTTATAIYCANVTTGASTKVSASGYKGA